MNDEKYFIRQMEEKDLAEVVMIHQQGFPRFFLSFLGYDFLFLLYQGFLIAQEGITLVCEIDGTIKGFVSGVTNQKGFYKRLLKEQKWVFAFSSLKPLFKKPSIFPRLLRALRKPNTAIQTASSACLMSIAVSPDANGKGIGKILVQSFSKELKNRGINSFSLTTDRDKNDAANNFYKKLGFTIHCTFETPEGRWMNEYIFKMNEN